MTTKIIAGQKWEYNEAEGFYFQGSEIISRSERNENVWVRWTAGNYAAGTEHKSLKRAALNV